MHRNTLLGALLIVLACVDAYALEAEWTGKCVGVSDGDTIAVMRLNKSQKIRLYGVDCPEKDQDFGRKAREFTASLVFGKEVSVKPVTRDQYGRVVAWVSVDAVSVNHGLVKAGLAWWYRRHAAKRKDLQQLEHEARNARIGLWSLHHPIPPWEFRRERR
jgi:micrococcal nuclease